MTSKILFIRNCSDKTRSNGFKQKQGKFRLDTWKKVFTVGVVRHWHRLPMVPEMKSFCDPDVNSTHFDNQIYKDKSK